MTSLWMLGITTRQTSVQIKLAIIRQIWPMGTMAQVGHIRAGPMTAVLVDMARTDERFGPNVIRERRQTHALRPTALAHAREPASSRNPRARQSKPRLADYHGLARRQFARGSAAA
jgi:hypothetical protein